MADSSSRSDARPETDVPAWVQDAVFYQIFPDRFARSERIPKASNLEAWEAPPTVYGYKGGDLLGVVERLDHLQDLGVTALYFNPIFQAAANHRYHTHDYFRVDPMLGGDAALRELLDAAHARGMRVVLDGVFNHASRGFFQFSDILENGRDSAYLDWFHVHRFPLNAYGEGEIGYGAWWNLPALPKFDTDTEAVREFLWSVGTYWLEFGIDGWRLDVPNEIDDDAFWREFRRRCRAVDPECYIVGEIWTAADRWLRGDQFDAVMNYPFTRAAFGFVADELNDEEIARSGYGAIPGLDAAALGAALVGMLERHPPAIAHAQLNLLGSHDTPRALNALCGDEAALRMALALMFAFPGAPCLYYGDEIGLDGGHDPGCREGMPWGRPESWNRELLEYVRGLVRLRRREPALRRGGFAPLHAAGRRFAFARWGGAEDAAPFVVVLNAEAEAVAIDASVDAPVEAVAALPEGTYRDGASGLELALEGGRLRSDEVPARTAGLFQRV